MSEQRELSFGEKAVGLAHQHEGRQQEIDQVELHRLSMRRGGMDVVGRR